METEIVFLRTIDKNQNISKAELELIEKDNFVKINFRLEDILLSEKDEFPFNALNKIRLELELRDLRLICQGCRIDVHPIGIYFYAYELELGRPAINSVYIFEDIEDIKKIATVKQQEEFYNKWLKSVGYSESSDKIDITNPQNTIGSYWHIINLVNWEIQSNHFKNGVISSIEKELKKIKQIGFPEALSLKEKFEKHLKVILDID